MISPKKEYKSKIASTSRRGYTLVELVVSMMLLSLAILLISAILSPAGKAVRRLEDLNNAQIVADNIVEVIKSELENAQDYVKCYNGEENIENNGGLSSGNIIEFKNSDGYAVVISADGSESTTLKRPSGVAGNIDETEKGYLILRYYQYNGGNKYIFRESASCVARAFTHAFPRSFYVGYKVSLNFTVNSKTINVAVDVYKDNPAEPSFSADTTVDLRYSPTLIADTTAYSVS